MKQVFYHILTAVVGILLFAAGITDIRMKQVGRRFIVVLGFACVAAVACKGDFSIMDAAGGVAVGLCAIGLSYVSGEQLGRGDGIVIAVVGLVLGGRKCLAAVSVASLMMCVAAILTLVLRKGDRHTRLPFLPALFAGYVFCMVM